MEEEKKFGESLKFLAKSSIIFFIGIVLSKVLTYLYRIIIAREFGPLIYGIFSLAIMLTNWSILFSNLGLAEGLTRFLPIYRGKKQINKAKRLFRTSTVILSVTGITAGIALFMLSPFLANKVFEEPSLLIFLRIFSITVPFSIVSRIFLSVLQSYEKIGWLSFLSNILPPFIKVTLILFFIAIGISTNSILLSHLISIMFIFFIAFFICKRAVSVLFKGNINRKTDKIIIKEVAAYSIPLFFAGMAWNIFNWIDSFTIGYFQTAVEVGIYNSAVPIAMLLAISPQLFMHLFFPLVTKSYFKGEKELVKQLSQQLGKWIFIINFPLFILLFLFPGAFLDVLFGTEYLAGINALRLLSIGAFFLSFFEIPYRLVSMKGKSKTLLLDIVAMAIVNFILNLFLVPLYGITGAAISTMTSFIVLSLILVYQSYHYISIIPIRRKMVNVALAGLIAALLLLFAKSLIHINSISLIILTIFFFGLYILLVFLFNGLDRNDFMVINSFIRKTNK